ncbi:hypothetical protein KSS87_022000 [Heliosperma pusillum]|nr:hypothetical protein KSS87_022000 [Heliosperma pusillum]
MRSANCSPISYPMLPPTHQHRMWDAWDMAAELCLSKLTSLIHDETAEYQPSPFFTEQLIAFEVWLDHGSEQKKPPEQLPIVLRILLSQCHRHQALVLLGRFLDMGPWAVDQALSVGIFPYVLKLLQTTAPELRGILIFIWAKILALDKSCQVDLVKDGGHTYFIRCLDSVEQGTYPEERAMAAFVLAVIVDGHKWGQEACVEAGLVEVCLKYLQVSTPDGARSEPLFLQWLCLCLGKLWEDFTEAQILGLQAGATNVTSSSLLLESLSEVRASAVFALGTLLDIGFESLEDGGDGGFDDDEMLKAEISIIKSLLSVLSDGSPLVRAEVAVALARFAFGHSGHLKPVAAAYLRSQPSSGLSGLHVNIAGSGYSTPKHYIPPGSILTSQIGPLVRIGGDSTPVIPDEKAHASSPLATGGILHGSPLSDDSSHHSDSGNGIMNHAMRRPLDNALYLECILAMCTLAKDPSPRVSRLGRKVLSIVGIEQVVARPIKHPSSSVRPIEPAASAGVRLSGLARSLSWFDMNSGHHPLTFRTPPVSPPRSSYITGIRRVSSLELRPHSLNSPDSGLADSPLGYTGSHSERSLLPRSTIYSWSCGNFSKSLITSSDESEDISARREAKEKSALNLIAKSQHNPVSKLNNQIASWDTKFEGGTKATLLQPFSPVVVAADESEKIRIWNYEEPALLNSFDNREFPNKGIPKLCFLNELDDTLLLVASGDGNVRIWKDYMERGKQKLVTAFCSITVQGPSTQNVNVTVDWQQQSGYLVGDRVSRDIPSIKVWDLNKEQLLHSLSSYDCSISALAASQIHESQFAAGFFDGSVRLFDIRTPDM